MSESFTAQNYIEINQGNLDQYYYECGGNLYRVGNCTENVDSLDLKSLHTALTNHDKLIFVYKKA